MLANITDRESFRAWLDNQPKSVAVLLASRTALRVLPLTADWIHAAETSEQRAVRAEALLLPCFRAIAVSWLAGTWPSHEAEPLSAANSAARSASTIWRQIGADTALLEQGHGTLTLGTSPLWHGAVPEGIARPWKRLRALLLDLDQNWQVWVDWYEDRLNGPAGRAPIEQLELDRVLVPKDEDWKLGAAHVNDILAKLEAKYRPTEIPDDDPTAPAFGDDGGRITEIAYRQDDEIAKDQEAVDLHGEAAHFSQELASVAGGEGGENTNRFNNLLAASTRFLEALGDGPETVRPGLLIPRAVALENALKSDDARQGDEDL